MTGSPRLLIVITAVLLLGGCSLAHASQTLTLSLDTPALGQKSGTPAAKSAPKNNPVKVGRVGVVHVSIAYIYKSKSSKSRRYATVKADTPLAVVKEEGSWYGVLMSNGAIGWIPCKNVTMTGYALVKTKPDTSRGSAVSRGAKRLLASGSEVIRTALGYSGVSYVYGGTNPARGMDCSAFVRSVFSQHGTNLPRTSREQARVGNAVPFDQLQPGDRLYFACHNPHIDHCGIYAGNGYFVHCSRSRNGVGVDSLASDFYWRSLVTARRS